MKKNLVIFLIPAFLATLASGQSVTFYKENTLIKLDNSRVKVTGEYHFRNNYSSDVTQTMFLPLPLAIGDLKVDSISIFDEAEHICISHYRKLPAGLFFQVSFHGQEQKKIRVFYIMDHDGKNIKYLAMTHIQYWKRPLAQATYTLQVEDPSIIIDSTSYKHDEVLSVNSKITHTWQRANFNPDRELEIWFHMQK
jgi:hypothetical protein